MKSSTTTPRLTRLTPLAAALLATALACGPRFTSKEDSESAGASHGDASAAAGTTSVSGGGARSASDGGGVEAASMAGGAGGAGRAGAASLGGAAGSGGSVTSGGSVSSGGSVNSDGLAGAAGFGAMGGLGTGGEPAHCTPESLIDDMEDGDDRNCPNQQRNGEWWSSTGTLTGAIDPQKSGNFPAFPLAPDARANSRYGMRLSGTGFGHADEDWASLGFNLIDGAAYDLTAYTGLAFYAKSRAGGVSLHVEVATDTTTPTSEGGACQDDCNDHFSQVVAIDGTWREYSVTLASLQQEGWGIKPKDLAHARFVFFAFLGTDGGPAAFDFLIDDVRLY